MSTSTPAQRGAARRRGAHAYALLAVAGLLAFGACAGPGGDQAGQVAQTFEQLAGSDAGKACDLLSGHTRQQVEKAAGKSCAEALGDQQLPEPSPVRTVEVYGHDALAHLGNDTVFLARFPEGWKVTAAGCKPGSTSEEPFDCDVSGG